MSDNVAPVVLYCFPSQRGSQPQEIPQMITIDPTDKASAAALADVLAEMPKRAGGWKGPLGYTWGGAVNDGRKPVERFTTLARFLRSLPGKPRASVDASDNVPASDRACVITNGEGACYRFLLSFLDVKDPTWRQCLPADTYIPAPTSTPAPKAPTMPAPVAVTAFAKPQPMPIETPRTLAPTIKPQPARAESPAHAAAYLAKRIAEVEAALAAIHAAKIAAAQKAHAAALADLRSYDEAQARAKRIASARAQTIIARAA